MNIKKRVGILGLLATLALGHAGSAAPLSGELTASSAATKQTQASSGSEKFCNSA